MFNYICGKIVEINEGAIVLANNNIGYEIAVSSYTCARFNVGDEVQLFTHLQVREDGLALYGFAAREEREMFNNLITISGIGPKLAVTILSGISLHDLAMAIVTNDPKALKGVKGVGNKTAERIVLELKEKITSVTPQEGKQKAKESDNAVNVVFALQTLGLTKQEAKEAVAEIDGIDAMSLEEAIVAALRSMGR